MRYGPPVRFTRNGNGSAVAYQVVGDGDLDLVFVLGWPSHLALLWEYPPLAEFLDRLASFARLILFDRVGNGMSDRGPTGQAFESWMDDITAVLDAVGSRRTAVFGCHLGGRLALLFAATHPERTTSVVTFGAHPATLRDDDYPWGSQPDERAWLLDAIGSVTSRPYMEDLIHDLAPSAAGDALLEKWWRTLYLSAASPVESIDEITAMGPVDIRRLLPAIRVPVLVMHRAGDRMAAVEASRYMAERLPQAQLRVLPGDEHLAFAGDQDAVLGAAQEFLTGLRPVADRDRVVLTVMFTDIVDSTGTAARLGDKRWERLLAEHDEVVRSQLQRFRGQEVETTGDGFLATFDGPARAIRAAAALHAELAEYGLAIRVGLHTGECELVDGHVRGIAVHIAARVMAHAGAGEVLCSRTVKDLVAGAGFAFADRGVHRLKGVPEDWQLYAVDVVPR
jgi:class 3 adenylate cyclase